MKTKDFIDSLCTKYKVSLTIRQNKNVQGLGNIFYNDVFEICPCPLEEIYEDVRENYSVTFPGDFVMPHPNMSMIESRISNFLYRLETDKEFKELVEDNKK